MRPKHAKNQDDYQIKRDRNNASVQKSREKARQQEAQTTQRVDQLKAENADLERRVDILNKELQLLKEMFLTFAKGGSTSQKATLSDEELQRILNAGADLAGPSRPSGSGQGQKKPAERKRR